MPAVNIGPKQIHYWVGRRSPSEGREVVLFIHGAGGGENVWNYQKAFFERQFHPLIIELSGHGKSEGEGEQEIGRYAEEVRQFLNAMGFFRVTLVGHSMGGAIVQTLALTHPEVIDRIVLVATGARLKVSPILLNGLQHDLNETVRKIAQSAYSRKAPPGLIEEGISELMRSRPEVLYGDFLACDRFDLMNEIEKVDLPTLILTGEEDQLTPVAFSQFLHLRIRHSKIEALPDAGHMVMIESAQAFNEKVGSFIADELKGSKECQTISRSAG